MNKRSLNENFETVPIFFLKSLIGFVVIGTMPDHNLNILKIWLCISIWKVFFSVKYVMK